MRPCGLGLWVILAAAFVIGAEARSSSVLSTQSSTEVDISDFKPSEDAPRERKRLKDRGLVEGENVGDAIFITAETEPGREEGTHTGRNPKKLKHRRLHAVEFEERRLRENDCVTPAGDFDVEGALRLAKAEQDRAKGNQHRKFYSLEQLDRMYRTSEGDVRLGIAPAPTQENITVAIKRDRWARRSHLVDMGTPGKMQSAIPKEMLKYRTPSEEIVVFVDGSVGHRYAITIEDDATVRELKEKVWVEERHARWELCGLRDKDAAKGFNIEEQALLLRGLPLDSDARMLGRFNITTYTILRVVPPLTPYNETELADLGDFYDQLIYWREREKLLETQEDSNDDDSTYRQVKAAWAASGAEAHEFLLESLQGFAEFQKEALRVDPNMAFKRHEKMDEKWEKEAMQVLDELEPEALLKQAAEDAIALQEQLNKGALEERNMLLRDAADAQMPGEVEEQDPKSASSSVVSDESEFELDGPELAELGLKLVDDEGKRLTGSGNAGREDPYVGRGGTFRIPQAIRDKVLAAREQVRAEKSREVKEVRKAKKGRGEGEESESSAFPLRLDD